MDGLEKDFNQRENLTMPKNSVKSEFDQTLPNNYDEAAMPAETYQLESSNSDKVKNKDNTGTYPFNPDDSNQLKTYRGVGTARIAEDKMMNSSRASGNIASYQLSTRYINNLDFKLLTNHNYGPRSGACQGVVTNMDEHQFNLMGSLSDQERSEDGKLIAYYSNKPILEELSQQCTEGQPNASGPPAINSLHFQPNQAQETIKQNTLYQYQNYQQQQISGQVELHDDYGEGEEEVDNRFTPTERQPLNQFVETQGNPQNQTGRIDVKQNDTFSQEHQLEIDDQQIDQPIFQRDFSSQQNRAALENQKNEPPFYDQFIAYQREWDTLGNVERAQQFGTDSHHQATSDQLINNCQVVYSFQSENEIEMAQGARLLQNTPVVSVGSGYEFEGQHQIPASFKSKKTNS